MGREYMKRDILNQIADDIVSMYKEKRSLEIMLGIVDESVGESGLRSEAYDFLNTNFQPSKYGLKSADVKRAIDRAVDEQCGGAR